MIDMDKPTNLIRIVLDTNVFVAAYWAETSASARLIKACIDGFAQAQYTPEIRREVEYVLNQIRVSQAYLDHMQRFWESAVEVSGVAAVGVISADPDDQKFLEAAVGSDADFLVTNDDHLLSISYVGRTEILPPRSMIKILGI